MIYTYLLPKPDKKFTALPCEKCPMGANSRKVGARGTVDSPLVIILEAPGTEELKYGAPVCGPSGDLLNKSVPPTFDFDDAYIINAMQCRPPKTKNLTRDKEFKARACVACRARVLEQVFQYPRKCILALGGWSNSSLTGNYNFKITQKRGEVYSVENPETKDKVVVVPAVHPAYLLRGAGNPRVFRDDISLAYNLAYSTETLRPQAPIVRDHKWVDPKNTVVEHIEDVIALRRKLQHLSGGNLLGVNVAADIETSGFIPITDYILCVGFYFNDPTDCAAIIPGRALCDEAFSYQVKLMLADPLIRFIWQFGKFDEKFLRYNELLDEDQDVNHEDTGLLSYTLSEATKDHDLDEQAKNTLGAPEHKNALKRWVPNKKSSYANVPEPVLFDYTAKDLKKTLLLWEHNRPLVSADDNCERLYTQTLMPASHFLAGVEEYGIAVDWDFVRINRDGANEEDVSRGLVDSLYDKDGNRIEVGLTVEMAQLLTTLAELVGYPVNPNAPEDVSKLLYDRYKLTINGRRPTDTTKETLAKLPNHPAVKLIRHYRKCVKMRSTYVGAIERLAIDSIIHTTFKLHVTPTGRLSSSEPNLQNIPREGRFRRMYRARPGHRLLEGDYNSAELRMLAALSGDVFLTGVFLDDKRNLHDEVSVTMYGADFTPDQRIRAKAINFGIPYGRDAFSIAMEFDISPREAQRLIDAWFAKAPEAEKFLNKSAKAAQEGRSLITIFGRKRRPGVVSPERLRGLQNEFKNFHMQSPISDFTLHAAMEMKEELRRIGARAVNLIHDSTLTEVPDDIATIKEAARIIKTTMETVPTKWIDTPIQFKVDLKIGTHWGLAKSYEKWLAVAQTQPREEVPA